MKKLFFSILSLFLAYTATADPHDCMSKEDAEALAKKIINQYIMDYCDCCDEISDTPTSLGVSAKLLFVQAAEVVPCSYDEGRFSVKISYNFVAAYDVAAGKLEGKALTTDAQNADLRISENVSLNYHFFLSKGKPRTLYGLLGKKAEGGCKGVDRFPTAKEAPDNKYKAFLGKK